VNEKWSCPSPRTVTALVRAGVTVVAGSDSHHCRDIGRYDRWVLPALSAIGA
jgi:putative hydrolase